jgi:transcriptional regulator with XRE-family HTH domain
MEISGRFARNLFELRRAADLSQEELAFRATIHRTQISLMESGGRLPRLDTLVKLAGALECSVAELTVGMAWEPSFNTPGGMRIAPTDRVAEGPARRGRPTSPVGTTAPSRHPSGATRIWPPLIP